MNTLKRGGSYFWTLALVAMATTTSSCVKNAIVSTGDGTSNAGFSKQFGTSSSDIVQAVAFAPTDGMSDGGSVIAGSTFGSLFEQNAGGSDIFVIRYDAAGNTLWSRQFGMSSAPSATGMETVTSIAYQNGSTFVTGNTQSSLFSPSFGAGDIFVFKLDSQGKLVWSKQIGTPLLESTYAIAVDSGGDVYIAGSTTGSLASANAGSDDAYIAKLSGSSGTMIWQNQYGATNPQILRYIAIDTRNNDVYTLGETGAILYDTLCGAQDLFVKKQDTNGNLIWQKQLGSSAFGSCTGNLSESAGGIALAPKKDKVYIAGESLGSLFGETTGGSSDVFIAALSMSAGGTQPITGRQYGVSLGSATSGFDSPRGIYYNAGEETITIAGITTGNLGGANLGGQDYFTMKVDANFYPLSFGHYGSSQLDQLFSFAVDSTGYMLFGGSTNAGWFTPFQGGPDDAIAYKAPSL